MQQDYNRRRLIFIRSTFCLVIFGLIGGAGCIERPTTIDPVPAQPFAGTVLKVAASDPRDQEFLKQLSRGWASRTGADVQVLTTPWDGTADVGLIPPAEVPRWAEAGQLAEIPGEFRRSNNPYRWDDLNSIYSVRLTMWGKSTYALPVMGEGAVLVYRKDAIPAGSVPATWEDLLETAVKLGAKSLPPLPNDSHRLNAEFFAAAASYDHLAVGQLGSRITEDFFAFQFDPTTGLPRLEKPAFQHVADLFQKLGKYRSPAADAPTAFQVGEAKIGILTLKELGQIPSALKEQLGVAPIPGARLTFDAKDQPRPTTQATVNRVPYLGWGGRMGVVSAKCAAPEAASNFLAELGMPERTSLDLIAAPQWGAGPYRTSQLDNRARPRWYSYGLTSSETERLTSALRENMGSTVQNYRLHLRTPNQHEFANAFDEELRAVLKSDQPANLAKANERWKAMVEKMPEGEWKRQLRKSLGL